jgi:hypothetical protein
VLTSHKHKLLVKSLLNIAVFRLDCILNGTRNRVINAENRSLDQLDFSRSVSSESICSAALSRSWFFRPQTLVIASASRLTFGFPVRRRSKRRRSAVVQCVAARRVGWRRRRIERYAIVTRVLTVQQRLLLFLLKLGVVFFFFPSFLLEKLYLRFLHFGPEREPGSNSPGDPSLVNRASANPS